MRKCTRCGRPAGLIYSLCPECIGLSDEERRQPPAPIPPSPIGSESQSAAGTLRRFRYIGPTGTEHELLDVDALAEACRQGTLFPSTMLFDSKLGRWLKAAEHDVFVASRGTRSPQEQKTVPSPSQAAQVATGGHPRWTSTAPDNGLRRSKRRAGILANWCVGFLVVGLVAGALVLAVSLWLIDQSTFSEGGLAVFSAAMILAGVADLVSGVAFTAWLFSAYSMLRVLGSRRTDYSPWWTIIGPIIPFVSLVMPYLLVKEAWLRTEIGNSTPLRPDKKGPPQVRRWWAYTVAGIVLSTGMLRSGHNDLIEDTADLVIVVLLLAIAQIAAIAVVLRLNAMQQALNAEATATGGVVQPN